MMPSKDANRMVPEGAAREKHRDRRQETEKRKVERQQPVKQKKNAFRDDAASILRYFKSSKTKGPPTVQQPRRLAESCT